MMNESLEELMELFADNHFVLVVLNFNEIYLVTPRIDFEASYEIFIRYIDNEFKINVDKAGKKIMSFSLKEIDDYLSKELISCAYVKYEVLIKRFIKQDFNFNE